MSIVQANRTLQYSLIFQIGYRMQLKRTLTKAGIYQKCPTRTSSKFGWNRGGGQFLSKKTCNISETRQGRTKRKLLARFRYAPKLMTLDDLERLIRTVAEKMRFTEPTTKIWLKINP